MVLVKIIKEFFPNLTHEHQSFIIKLMTPLLEYMNKSFYFNSDNEFNKQLSLNNNQDYKTIMLLLFPYLENLPSKVKNLDELIYHKKNIILEEFKNKEILELSRELPHTNFLISLLNQHENDFKIDIQKVILTNYHLTLTTIRQVANKLMPNWINIFPIPSTNSDIVNILKINDDKLYNDSIEIFTKCLAKPELVKEYMFNPKGLWLGDYYNVIVNHLFYNIIPCKFLIYEYLINGEIKNGLYFFKENFPENLTFREEPTELFYIKLKNIFNLFLEDPTYKWKDYVETLLTRFIYLGIPELKDTTTENEKIFLNTINNHIYLDNLQYDNKLEEYESKIEEIINSEDLMSQFFRMIKIGFDHFVLSPFYHFYFDEKDNLKDITFIYKDLTAKNIYNIAKLISYDLKDTFVPKPKNVITDPLKLTQDLFEKLGTPGRKWLNFNRNLDKIYPGITNYNSKYDELAIQFRELIPILVQDILIRNGLLNKFVSLPQVNIKDTKPLKKYFKEHKEDFDNSFYYINNKKYQDLPKIIKYENNQYKKESYFDLLLSKNTNWKFFFANNWITQINFYTHFLHQQVIFVTGATGQGKSTQIPKLTLYGTKAYLHNTSAHVVGTQPRKIPTKNNISRISWELGIPTEIEIENFTKGTKVPSDNYYLQFKHSTDNHIKKDLSLKLTMMTDGSLLSQIKNNPYLKSLIEIDGRNQEFGMRNLYDVVMIDESHEHNPNMDIILSFMKNCLYFNKQIRLLIISATMKDDEPTYRSYYSILNDNLTYPTRNINSSQSDKFINANLLDRRFHISPPGGTTQYKIDETYYKLSQQKNHLENSKYIQESSYNTVLNIIKTSPKGEILLFLTGAPEIRKATEELNKLLPKKVVALPYYSSLNSLYQDIVVNLDTKIKNIRNKKENIHLEWDDKFIIGNEPKGQFERAIILATNVAEASITIPNLKFVIDNGYAKESKYDVTLNESVLTVQPISESSRLQRKGRVGRIGPGNVHYLYSEGDRALIRSKLGITQVSPLNTIINLVKNSGINLIDPTLIKNMYDFNLKPLKTRINEIRFKNLSKLGLSNQIQFMEKELYENFYLNIDKYKIFYTIKSTGLSYPFLLDQGGLFYIIHPLENRIKRNSFYQIFEFDNEKIDHIPDLISEGTKEFIQSNFNIVMFDNAPRDSLLLQKSSELETELGLNEFQMGYREGISLLYANGFGHLDVTILTLLLIGSYRNLKNLFNLTNKNIKKYLNNVSSNGRVSSDLLVFIKLAKNIINNLTIKDESPKVLINRFKFMVQAKIKIFQTTPTKLKNSEYLVLNKMKSQEILNKDEGIIYYLNSGNILLKHYKSKVKLNFDNFDIYDLDKIEKIIEDYLTLKIRIKTFNYINQNKLKETAFNWSKKLINFKRFCRSDDEEILYCILSGKSDKIVFNLPEKSSFYGDFSSFFFKDIIPVQKAKYMGTEILTSIPNQTLQHYYSFSTFDNIGVINNLTNIPIEWLISYDPIRYSPYNFNNIWESRGKIINIDNNKYLQIMAKIKNSHPLICKLWFKKEFWLEKVKGLSVSKSEQKNYTILIKKILK